MKEKRHNYEYEVDLSLETAPTNVIRLVGHNKRVLEIGCGPGSITKLLAQQNGCRVTGMELDLEAIKKVTPYCEQIIQADLNSTDWPLLLNSEASFDVVVAADVLEHLYDPWTTLKRMTPLINSNGYLVISLPHAGHAAVMSCLINGDFGYRDWGLLDRTHIRFFCIKNIYELFAQAKLKIVDVKYVIKPPEETEFADSWSSLPPTIKTALSTSPHSHVYQVVVKAVPLDFPGEEIPMTPPHRTKKIAVTSKSFLSKHLGAHLSPRVKQRIRTSLELFATQSVYKNTSTVHDTIPHNTLENGENNLHAGTKGHLKNDNRSPLFIAFYLTQFHPTEENDRWWGKGFTEWTNVTKATPLFNGHFQPHLPSDFGFYDLRVRETRRDQIQVAKQYGIDGFCYHYYWFSGTRILNKPLDDMLADPESDMPFCLCWANENWTRRWDAADHEVLIAQKYLQDDDMNFIKSLVPFFEDKRYIRLDNKPLLIVYRPQHLPDACNSIKIWREYCHSIGLGDIHICAALTHGNEDYSRFGCDSGVEFPPHNLRSANINHNIQFYNAFCGNVMQYATIAQSYLDRTYSVSRVFKTVFPSWDNTARTKERALVVLNGTPNNYEYWLSATIDQSKSSDEGEKVLFINAWNEWAEGCHLEPDRRFGDGFLQATINAKNGLRRFTTFPDISLPQSDKPHDRTFWKDLHELIRYYTDLRLGNLKLVVNRSPSLRLVALPLVRITRNLKKILSGGLW